MTTYVYQQVSAGIGRDRSVSRRHILKGIPAASLAAGAFGWTDWAAVNAEELRRQGKACILLWMQGGASQYETFSPKPGHASGGDTAVIDTSVPGIQVAENLPNLAKQMDHLAVVRSMATDDNIHSSSGHWVLTGKKYVGPNARTLQPTDWPYFGSHVKRYRPSDVMPALSTVMVPDIIRLNENVTPAGQTGGLMGLQWSPERFVGCLLYTSPSPRA